jgi:hypothetical protein
MMEDNLHLIWRGVMVLIRAHLLEGAALNWIG